MTRSAAIILVAIVTLASTAPAASAAGHDYKHYVLENPTAYCLHFDVSWEGGRTWRSEKLCSGARKLSGSREYRVAAMIRFVVDMTDGTAWRTYDHALAYAGYRPSLNTPSMAYHFEIDGRILDLFR